MIIRPPRIHKAKDGRLYYIKNKKKHYFNKKDFKQILKKVMSKHKTKRKKVKIYKNTKIKRKQKILNDVPKNIPISMSYTNAIQREQEINKYELSERQKQARQIMSEIDKQKKYNMDFNIAIKELYGTEAGVVPSIKQIQDAYFNKQNEALSTEDAKRIQNEISEKYKQDELIKKMLNNDLHEMQKDIEKYKNMKLQLEENIRLSKQQLQDQEDVLIKIAEMEAEREIEDKKRIEELEKENEKNKRIEEEEEIKKEIKKEQEQNEEFYSFDDDDDYIGPEYFQFGSGENNKGLSNIEIDNIMAPFKHYNGTFAIDQIKQIPINNKFGFIINTEPIKNPIGHWCAVWIDAVGDKSIEWFDPFGDDPPKKFDKDIKYIINKINPDEYLKYKVNRIISQDDRSDNCGWISINFLLERMNGKKFKEVTKYNVQEGEMKAELLKRKFNYI